MERIRKASENMHVSTQVLDLLRKEPDFFSDQIKNLNFSMMNSNCKENAQSSPSKPHKKALGDKYWIVYPNSEQYGHLSLDEVIQLVHKSESRVFLIKNKQKNAVFTIDFFKEEFILKRNLRAEANNGDFLENQQRKLSLFSGQSDSSG